METQDTQNTQPILDSEYQRKFNYGQARINFELNEVDKDVIKSLNMIVEVLKAVKALPGLAHDMKDIDFSSIEKALADACKRSQEVASIKPPGCEAPPYPAPISG